MVIDAVLYNGESDLFKLRYEILKDYVDEFVVVEFGKTFRGNDKESHPINLPKVSYHFFTNVKDLHPPNLPSAFAMEYNQREMIKECLTHLNDEDIVIFGDCDEIWDEKALNIDLYQKLRLRVYAYHLNNRSNENFTLGPVVMRYELLKQVSLNYLRSTLPVTEEYYGWHFTNMGGVAKLRYKIESYGHQEYHTPEVIDTLEFKMRNNVDYIGRNFQFWIDEADWPEYLVINRKKYTHLLK